MSLNELLLRAREYVYDRQGFEGFVEDVRAAAPEEQQAVAEYLAGHGLALGRWLSKRGREVGRGPWFWLDRLYLPAIRVTLGPTRTLEVLGRGVVERADELARLGIREEEA